MSSLMNSPMMEGIMNNPDILRNMMMNNPQMQAIMDANPQIRHALNDPASLRQTMEMMRNPHAMQQAMRSQDLMISQLENHPLGFNALRRMHEEVTEPMMEAAANAQQTPNPWAQVQQTPVAQPTSLTSTALPNPWGGSPNPNPNPWAGLSAGATPGATNPFSMLQNPMLSGLGDESQMMAMMSNPLVQQQMAAMMQNPQMLQQIASMNPQMAPIVNSPQFRAMMSNPQLLQQMMNPSNMQVCCYSFCLFLF
jgi:ubiquilin